MNAVTVLRFALRNLQRAPIRSSLTALGVIIGVASVVATVSIGNGARAKIQETLAKPEARSIFVAAVVPRERKRRYGATLSHDDGLKPEDYYAVRQSIGNNAAVSPRIYAANFHAQANGRATEILLEGIDVDGFITLDLTLLEGATFNQLDVRNAASVCALSRSLADFLFSDRSAVGQVIRVNDTAFTIIGLVDDMGSAAATAASHDMHVYIPFTSLLRRLDTNAKIDLRVQAWNIENVKFLQQDISDLMEKRRSGRKADFIVNAASSAIKDYADGSLTVARLLAAVGAISLVVGGIGIMNIMLVSVTERTREIGVRMAVGTRKNDILGQFLAEAIALSLLGGLTGVAVGWCASMTVTRVNSWPAIVGLDSVLTALFCSFAVGVLFGVYPARQAALMRPADALRI